MTTELRVSEVACPDPKAHSHGAKPRPMTKSESPRVATSLEMLKSRSTPGYVEACEVYLSIWARLRATGRTTILLQLVTAKAADEIMTIISHFLKVGI